MLKPLPLPVSKAGPIIAYLNDLNTVSPEMAQRAKEARSAVRRCLATPDGAILLDLLEKSTTQFFLPPGSDPSACDAINAQRFIALDLRRLMSDEVELAREDHAGTRGRGRLR